MTKDDNDFLEIVVIMIIGGSTTKGDLKKKTHVDISFRKKKYLGLKVLKYLSSTVYSFKILCKNLKKNNQENQ